MEELKEYTNEVLYESYRTQKLASGVIQTNENNIKYVLFGVGVCNLTDPPSPTSPLSKFEEERIAHDLKMQKMESEMKAVFHQKVAEKESKLKVSEDEVKHTKFIVHLFLQGFSKQLCNAFSLSQNTQLYARHREMKEKLELQRIELEDKKKRIESGRPSTPEKPKTKKSGLFK